MKVQTRIASVLVLVSAVALTATGCSSDSDDADVTAPPAVEVTTDPTTEPAADSDSSQNDALDAVIEAAQPAIPAAMEQFGDLYSEITITGVHPGTLVYTYTYAEPTDPEKSAAALDGVADSLQTSVDTQVAPSLKAAGVTEDVQVTYTYNNSDGSEIWSRTFTPAE